MSIKNKTLLLAKLYAMEQAANSIDVQLRTYGPTPEVVAMTIGLAQSIKLKATESATLLGLLT